MDDLIRDVLSRRAAYYDLTPRPAKWLPLPGTDLVARHGARGGLVLEQRRTGGYANPITGRTAGRPVRVGVTGFTAEALATVHRTGGRKTARVRMLTRGGRRG